MPHATQGMSLFLRLALAAAGLAIGALSILPPRRLLEERTRDLELLAETGLDERAPEIADVLDRETDPERADLVVARALLSDVLDQLRVAPTPLAATTVDEVAPRLVSARTLAEEARRRRPAAWQAHMIVGAATYLEWSLRRDRRVATEAAQWESPLRTAIALAPSQPEPKRFLTMAYLELWPMLSAEKRELARSMVAVTFEDPRILQRLFGPWLELTGDVDEALAAIPDEARTWQVVERLFAQQGRWDDVVLARRRSLDALRRECESRLTEAAALRGRQAARRARDTLLPIVTSIPVEGSWGDVLARTLERLPPGLLGKPATERLRLWLAWNLEGCALHRCRLPERSAARLGVLAGELPLPTRARIALAAGDLATAEAFERQADRLGSEPWAPYLIEKISHLLRRGEVAAATTALDAVHRSQRSTLPFLHAARAVAEATDDRAALENIELALEERARSTWMGKDWEAPAEGDPSGRFRLVLQVAERAPGLELVAERVPTGGAVIEVRIDGTAAALAPAGKSGQRLEIGAAIEPGLHLIEFGGVAGGAPVPGSGRLAAAPR